MLSKLLLAGAFFISKGAHACEGTDCADLGQNSQVEGRTGQQAAEGQQGFINDSSLAGVGQDKTSDGADAVSADAPKAGLIPYELARQAAAKLPIPACVMNDELRAWSPAADQENRYKLCPGDPELYNILFQGVDLMPKQRELLDEFLLWMD